MWITSLAIRRLSDISGETPSRWRTWSVSGARMDVSDVSPTSLLGIARPWTAWKPTQPSRTHLFPPTQSAKASRSESYGAIFWHAVILSTLQHDNSIGLTKREGWPH